MDERGIEKLWTSRKNVLKDLELRRKYHIKESDHMTLEQFTSWAEEEGFYDKIQEMKFSCMKEVKGKKNGQRIKVYWPAESKLGGSEFRIISADMESENLKHAIIIIRDSVTPHAQGSLRYLSSQKMYIHVFTLYEYQVDIFEHEKVPEHIICDSSEKKELMSVYNLLPSQIPKIKQSDAVIRRLGATRGQLIKIMEESDTMPGYYILHYRIVG
uniref:DNA-directed RNA polymerase subunit 5 n=1 Tax=Marseillevirus LCMAC101 TaxID=2506602 RepID=A0A481YS23_9VIRU|nr:MAG: DNA-directed RNA polymerase subunit 5 [Marseillevirus LCMAC101]